jgi:toxin ParE1/3/4
LKRYVLSRLASTDLREISSYSAQEWARQRATAYLQGIRQAIDRLALTPGLGVACDDIKPFHRKFVIGSHTIFYRPTTDRIEIIRILHQSMDVGRHLT